MQYLGDITAGSTIRGSFNTRTAAGVPITLGGTPVLSVYKDGGTTETTTGVTLTVDFDSRTGHHVFAIATSDAFYTTGSDYRVVITTGTVDGTSVVGTEVGSFSIQNRTSLVASAIRSAIGLASANLDTQLSNIPTAVWGSGTRTLTSFGTLVADIATAVWAAATRTLTAISDSAGITTLLTRIVGTLATGTHQPQSGDSFARLGAPVGASISADVQTRSTFAGGAVASVTNPVSLSVSSVSDVQSGLATQTLLSTVAGYLDTEIAAIKAKTDQLTFTVANQVDSNALSGGGSGLDAAGVRAALGLASANLDTQLSDLPTVAEFNARTLPSADYFVVSDYTAPDATKLVDVWRRLGLDPANPLVNTATLISAGSTLQIDVTQTSTTVTTTRQP